MLLTVASGIALCAWLTLLLAPWQPHRTRERLEATSEIRQLDDVTVLIPARNEAAVIERTLTALRAQGPGLEVIVVDDESSDATAELCRRCAAAARVAADGAFAVTVSLVEGSSRPSGWSGKLWALEQGLRQVRRRRLLLLDADIELAPGTIAALLDRAEHTHADLVSIMATLHCVTPAERLLAPSFVFFFKLLYPFALAAAPTRRTAAAAGGCILTSAESLRRLGGFAALRGELIDDCALAAALKRRGETLYIGLSRSVRSVRPYTFADFWRMVSRTAFTQLRYSPLRLLVATCALLVVFVAPPATLVTADSPAALALATAALGVMAACYLPVVRFYALPSVWSLTLPLAAVSFLGMTWHSALRYWRGIRARWKGRAYGVAE